MYGLHCASQIVGASRHDDLFCSPGGHLWLRLAGHRVSFVSYSKGWTTNSAASHVKRHKKLCCAQNLFVRTLIEETLWAWWLQTVEWWHKELSNNPQRTFLLVKDTWIFRMTCVQNKNNNNKQTFFQRCASWGNDHCNHCALCISGHCRFVNSARMSGNRWKIQTPDGMYSDRKEKTKRRTAKNLKKHFCGTTPFPWIALTCSTQWSIELPFESTSWFALQYSVRGFVPSRSTPQTVPGFDLFPWTLGHPASLQFQVKSQDLQTETSRIKLQKKYNNQSTWTLSHGVVGDAARFEEAAVLLGVRDAVHRDAHQVARLAADGEEDGRREDERERQRREARLCGKRGH